MDLNEAAKAFAGLARALRALTSPKPPSEAKGAAILRSALDILATLPVEALSQKLDRQRRELVERMERALPRRREILHAAAKEAGIPSKRFEEYTM